MEQKNNKLILAVLQGEDYDETVHKLNQSGFFVTLLSSTGGFLKRKSTTVMIGVPEEKVPEVLAILKQFAGKRIETVYQYVNTPSNDALMMPPTVQTQREAGGVTVFCLGLESIEKF